MKITKNILILFFISIYLFTGCKKATYLNSKVENVEFSKEGGKDTVILSYDAGKCKILAKPDWVDLNLTDSLLIIQSGKNIEPTFRTGNIVIENGDLKLSLPIKQLSNATYLTLSETSITIPKDGGTVKLDVETDGSEVILEGVENVTAEFKDGKVFFSGKGNNGKERRTNGFLVVDTIRRPVTIIEKGEICYNCNGSGRVKCSKCGGSGETVFPWGICYVCNGSGKTKCKTCKGSGK